MLFPPWSARLFAALMDANALVPGFLLPASMARVGTGMPAAIKPRRKGEGGEEESACQEIPDKVVLWHFGDTFRPQVTGHISDSHGARLTPTSYRHTVRPSLFFFECLVGRTRCLSVLLRFENQHDGGRTPCSTSNKERYKWQPVLLSGSTTRRASASSLLTAAARISSPISRPSTWRDSRRSRKARRCRSKSPRVTRARSRRATSRPPDRS